MDTNNDSSQGAVPADQPAPAGRPNQYIGYTQRSVQPNVIAPRPNAYQTTTPAAPAPAEPAVVEVPPVTPVEPVVIEPDTAPVVDAPVETPSETPVSVESPIEAPAPELTSEPAPDIPDPDPIQIIEPDTAPATDTATPVTVEPEVTEAPTEAPAESIAVNVNPTPEIPAVEPAPVVVDTQEPSADPEQAVQVAVTPAPEPTPPAPAIQMPTVADITPPPAAPSVRPSLAPVQQSAQPVGAPIDDFRPMPAAEPVATEAAESVEPPSPAPAPAAGPAINDVFTPPPRPFADPAGTAPAPVQPAGAAEPDEQELDHISNHLEAEAKTQPKHKAHFSFLHHHPKATAALLAAFVVLGGGGGFYMMHSGAAPNPTVVATWVPFVNKDAGFTAKYVAAPKHVKLNSGDGYVETSAAGEYGVRALDGSTTPDAVISADAINYGNGKVVKQEYKTVSGNDAVSGTITGTYKGKPALVSFQFLITSKDLYELYTVGYGTNPAPNTQYFFTTFKPADSE